MIMDAKEMETGSDKWMKHVVSGIVDELNNKKNSMRGLAPATAIKRKVVNLKHKYLPEELLPEDGLCRYLYQPGEQCGDQKQKATYLNWYKDTYRLNQIVEEPGNKVMYYLKDGPELAFVSGAAAHFLKWWGHIIYHLRRCHHGWRQRPENFEN